MHFERNKKDFRLVVQTRLNFSDILHAFLQDDGLMKNKKGRTLQRHVQTACL